MSIPPRFLDEIRARVSVSEIIGRTVKLIKAGREYKACCPFHHEKTPSFTINDDKHFYHCFGCGAHGDVISFLQQNNNLSFIEAVEQLAAQAGLQMPQSTPEEIERSKKAKDLYDLMEAATRFMQGQLHSPANKDVLEYVKSRGMGEPEQQGFRIGYAPGDRQAVRKHLAAQGFTDKDMIAAGIIRPSTKGGEPYAFFNDRVMFPVTDRQGRVIAFGGRALPDHLRPPSQSGFTPPKYINSGDTELFDKSRALYAISQARQASGNGRPIIVTEGYMDVIACHRAGFTGAVAPMGTALTEEQIILLWKIIADDAKVPILCFDGDRAGRKAAARAAENILPLLKPNHSARFAFLPDGQDPDDMLGAQGPQAFQKVLDAALPLIDFLWLLHTQGRDLRTPEARAGVAKELKDIVKTIADTDVQRHYQELVQEKISAAFFPRKDYGAARRSRSPGGAGSRDMKPLLPVKPAALAVKNDLGSRILLAGLLNHPHIFGEVEEECAQLEFDHPRLTALRQGVMAALAAADTLDKEALQHHLRQSGFEKEIGDILHESVYGHAYFVKPQADSASVLQKWKSFYDDYKGRHARREIRDGWKKVLETANQDAEERLTQRAREALGDYL